MVQVKQWITVNGVHVPIMEGETKQQAVDKALSNQKRVKDDEDKKNKQIAANKKQADEKNKEQADKSNSTSIEEVKDAFDRFTSDKYKEIRKAQMGERITYKKLDLATKQKVEVDVTEKYKKLGDIIEKEVTGHEYKGTLYRAIGVDEETAKSYKVGDTINQKGLSSWSTDKNSISMFGGDGEKRVIFIENGGAKNSMDVSKISLGKGENEVIQSSKNRQLITNVETKNGVLYVYVKDKERK